MDKPIEQIEYESMLLGRHVHMAARAPCERRGRSRGTFPA